MRDNFRDLADAFLENVMLGAQMLIVWPLYAVMAVIVAPVAVLGWIGQQLGARLPEDGGE